VERFHDAWDGGVLFLGHSETLWGISDSFRLEQREKVFFYRKPSAVPRPPRAAASPGAADAPRPTAQAGVQGPPAHAAGSLFVSPAMERVLEAERRADADMPEESLRLCREAAALDPACIEADYLMALLLRRSGRYAEALFHAERALETDPRFVLAEVEAAECLSLMGKPAEASRWRTFSGRLRFRRDGVSRKTLRHYVISRMPR
jgi:tetratricopeptide (TPR) repeat protein